MDLKPISIGILYDPRTFHTQKWCAALVNAGAKVTVFSFWEGEIPGVSCVKLPAPATRNGHVTYLTYLLAGRILRNAIKKYKIDILNPINATPFGVWAWAANVKIPVALVTMGSDVLEYPPRYGDRSFGAERRWESATTSANPLIDRLRHRVLRYFVGRALHRADYLTGDNRVLTDAARDWFGVSAAKIGLNRWGVEPDLFAVSETQKASLRQKYGIQPGQTVILSPRGMKPVYQSDIILAGIEQFLQKLETKHRKQVRCIVLSAGYTVSTEIEQQANRLQTQFPDSFLYVSGTIPREEVLQLWSLTDIFINAPIYDGYSNALAEGRYAGAIPIVNDTPATREVLLPDEHALFVEPFSAENLAETLAHSFAHLPEFRARMVPQNRQWIEANSMMDRSIQEFLAACRQLLP